MTELGKLEELLATKWKSHSLKCFRGNDPNCRRCQIMAEARELRKSVRRVRRKSKWPELLILELANKGKSDEEIMRAVRSEEGTMPNDSVIRNVLKKRGFSGKLPSMRGTRRKSAGGEIRR